MKTGTALFLTAFAFFSHSTVFADTFQFAPPSVDLQNGFALVPVDIRSLQLTLEFNVQTQQAHAHARAWMRTLSGGYPYFRFNPTKHLVSVKGRSITLDHLTLDYDYPVAALEYRVKPGEEIQLDMDYELPNVSFSESGVEFGTFMVDGAGQFLEAYAPANFEFDSFPLTVDITVYGATTNQKLYSNGQTNPLSPNHWNIKFPEQFTSSSMYFHLSANQFFTESTVYHGKEKEIPVTVYSSSPNITHQALQQALQNLKEIEDEYGPYLHNSFLAYIHGQGGMEYCGAAVTALGKPLAHEIMHSWFGRGVMPSSGNSGWIDEAIARWRDLGYPRAAYYHLGRGTHLADASGFSTATPYESYDVGSEFLSVIDLMLAQNGSSLKRVLREWYSTYRGQVIDTPTFQRFLEARLGKNLDQEFGTYVYGWH